MIDVLGRAWQMGTIQLDAQMPKQFGLTYMGADNVEHTPYVVHRALLGSLERFMGILIEHYAGAFPVWLAPVQVRVAAGRGERTARRPRELAGALRLAEGYRVDVDERDETLGKRIRDAELEKIPYVVVWGDRETHDAIAVRRRGAEGVDDDVARRAPRRDRGAEPVLADRRCRIPPRIGAVLRLRACKAGTASPLTSPAMARAGFNRVGSDEECRRCLQWLSHSKEEDRLELGDQPLRPRRRPEDRTRPVVQQDRINEQIRVPRVRLVGEDGEQIGIKDTKEALEYAFAKNLDLVEVAADADPPVARVMDYGK